MVGTPARWPLSCWLYFAKATADSTLTARSIWPRTPRDRCRQPKSPRGPGLIDPRYSIPFKADWKEPTGLFDLLGPLFGALRHQASFKPEELALAHQSENGSRFLIAPIRQDEDGNPCEYPLATDNFMAFGGFFSGSFRRRDFLQNQFVLDKCNLLFRSWPDNESMKDRYRVTRNGRPQLPIISVMPPLDTARVSSIDQAPAPQTRKIWGTPDPPAYQKGPPNWHAKARSAPC